VDRRSDVSGSASNLVSNLGTRFPLLGKKQTVIMRDELMTCTKENYRSYRRQLIRNIPQGTLSERHSYTLQKENTLTLQSLVLMKSTSFRFLLRKSAKSKV